MLPHLEGDFSKSLTTSRAWLQSADRCKGGWEMFRFSGAAIRPARNLVSVTTKEEGKSE